jgi:hypothetical protein
LLFFKFFIADFISSMVIGALMILFKSSVSGYMVILYLFSRTKVTSLTRKTIDQLQS